MGKTRITHFYSTDSQQTLFWSNHQQRGKSNVHSPGAMQLLSPGLAKGQSSLYVHS